MVVEAAAILAAVGVAILIKAIGAHRASAPYVFSWWDGVHGAALRGKPVRAVWMIVIASALLLLAAFAGLGVLLKDPGRLEQRSPSAASPAAGR